MQHLLHSNMVVTQILFNFPFDDDN